MLGSEVIDVGIGMALLFLFMSVIATALREAIENLRKTRSKQLETGLKELLPKTDGEAESMVDAFYKHPVIAALYKGAYVPGGKNLPSYIPRQSFSLAVLDIMAKASQQGRTLSLDSLRDELAKATPPNAIQRVVLLALNEADTNLDRVRAALEDWFDGTMDRVSGWYARHTGRILAALGFGAALFFNVDAITVAQHLVQDKALRQAVVAEAEQTVEAGTASPGAAAQPAATLQNVGTLRATLIDIGFPIGWRMQNSFVYPAPQTCAADPASGAVTCGFNSGWVKAFFGWVITALAIMLGAPFWFDVLNKFAVVRSTVKPKEKSPDEASADAQSPSAAPAAVAAGSWPPAPPAPPPPGPDLQPDLDSLAASTLAALAVSQGAFEPHAWSNNPGGPQAGVM